MSRLTNAWPSSPGRAATPRKRRRDLDEHPGALGDAVPREVHRRGELRAQVDRLSRRAGAGRREELQRADDVAHARRALRRVRRRLAELRDPPGDPSGLGDGALELLLEDAQPRGDGRERVVHRVGDPGGERAQAREPIREQDPLAQQPRLAHVGDGADGPDRQPVRVAREGARRYEDGPPPPVLRPHPVLDAVGRRLPAVLPLHAVREGGPVLRVDELHPRVHRGRDLRCRIAEHGPRGADDGPARPRVELEVDVSGQLEREAAALVRRADGLVHPRRRALRAPGSSRQRFHQPLPAPECAKGAKAREPLTQAATERQPQGRFAAPSWTGAVP